MRLIVGLGNPEDRYKGTRHNAGFMFLDVLAAHEQIAPTGESVKFSHNDKFNAEIAKTQKGGEDIMLIKPQTYMNRSGDAVAMIMAYYKIDIADLIVVSDDIDLPLGYARIRHDGSSGGQKGLQNIIDLLKTDQFTRLRIGIGAHIEGEQESDWPADQLDASNYVLSKFTDRELPVLRDLMGEVVEYIVPYLGEKSDRIDARTIKIR